jgi:hypothetical protein
MADVVVGEWQWLEVLELQQLTVALVGRVRVTLRLPSTEAAFRLPRGRRAQNVS